MMLHSISRKVRRFLISFFVFWMLGTIVVYAQFEGSFDIHQQLYGNKGVPAKEGKVSVIVKGDRIRINGLNGTKLPDQLGGMKTNSILIRLDDEDFIVFGDHSDAVQIKKAEIVNMLNLVSSVKGHFSSEDTSASKTNITTTSVRKTIEGYPCQKVVIRKFDDGKEMTADVWITSALKMNWGMLTEPWGEDSSEMAELLSPLWLKNGTIPIYAEVYEDGVKRMTIRIEHIEKRKIPSSKVMVPTDIHLVSFREMLLQKMFGG